MSLQSPGPHDRSYEWKVVALMTFGFAMVSLDRFIMYPLFPLMMRDLGLDYQDLGLISAAVALTLGISSMIFGSASDHWGKRGILVGSAFIFSVTCGLTGLAAGVGSLILIRAVMGVFEGAFIPTSIAAVVEASQPRRVGRNVGIHQLAAPLFGTALAPILAVQLVGVLPSWRWVFVLATIPGLLCAWLIHRTLRNTKPAVSHGAAPRPRLREVLAHRNVIRNILGFCFWLSPIIILGSLFPSYLTDHLHLTLEQMGIVISAMGFGGAAGALLVPALSDRLGRKATVVTCQILAIPTLVMVMRSGPEPAWLFVLLLVACALMTAVIALTHAITADSVPRENMSTATGLVVGVGEIVGGAAAPAVAGVLAKLHGIEIVVPLAIVVLAIGLVIALTLKPVDRSSREPGTRKSVVFETR